MRTPGQISSSSSSMTVASGISASEPEWMSTFAFWNLPRLPVWSVWEWVRTTVSTSFGNTPICLNDVRMAGHMYGVLGSTTMHLPSARMRVDVEWASFRTPSSRTRNPMQRTSRLIMPCRKDRGGITVGTPGPMTAEQHAAPIEK